MELDDRFKLSISKVFYKLLNASQKDDEVTLNDITRCQNILLKESEKKEKVIRKKICKKLKVDFCYYPIIWFPITGKSDNIFKFSIKKYSNQSHDIDIELIKDENGKLSIFNSTNLEYASYILDTAKEELNEYYNFIEETNLMRELKYYNINIDSNTSMSIILSCVDIHLGIYFMFNRMMWLSKRYHDNEFKIDVRYPECSYENINSLINNHLFIKIKDLPPYMQEKLYTIRKKQIDQKEKNREKINKLILKNENQKHK